MKTSSVSATTVSSKLDHDNAIFGSRNDSLSTTRPPVVREEPIAVPVKVCADVCMHILITYTCIHLYTHSLKIHARTHIHTHVQTDIHTDSYMYVLGMGDNQNFMSRYIMRIIITIIDIITISIYLTKILKL